MTERINESEAGKGSKSSGRWYSLILLALVYGLSNLDRYLLGILLPFIKVEMELSDTLLGLLTGAAFAIFYATLGLPIARLADRYSRKLIIAVSLGIFSVMTAACGLAGSFATLFAARVGVGIGEAGTSPASYSIISDLFEPERRSTAMAVLSMGASVGLLIGFTAGGAIAANYGWQWAFLAAGIPGVILTLAIAVSLHEPSRGAADGAEVPVAPSESAWQALVLLLSIPSYRNLVAGMALVQFAGTGLLNWLPSLLDRSHDLPPEQSGLPIALIVIVAGVIGTFLIGGILTDRLARSSLRWVPRVAAVGALVMSVGAAAVAVAPTLPLLFGAYLFSAIGSLCFLAPSLTMTQTLAPVRIRATSGALALMIANLFGLGLGAPVIGLISDVLSPSMGACSLAAALLLVPVAGLWAAFHYWRSAAVLPEELLTNSKATQS